MAEGETVEQVDETEEQCGIVITFAGPHDVRFNVRYVGTVHAGQIDAAAMHLRGYAEFLTARAIMAQEQQRMQEQAARQQVANMIKHGGPIIQ